MITKVCPVCNKEFLIWPYQEKQGLVKFCSKSCYSKQGRVEFNCDYCGKETKRDLNAYKKVKHHFCSQKCSGKFLKISPRKRKKSYITDNGYRFIYNPSHPFSNKNGYVYEHRLIAEKCLGRNLKSTEPVHHINGIKTDNRPENLFAFSSIKEHVTFDNPQKKTSKKLISNLI